MKEKRNDQRRFTNRFIRAVGERRAAKLWVERARSQPMARQLRYGLTVNGRGDMHEVVLNKGTLTLWFYCLKHVKLCMQKQDICSRIYHTEL